jgi:hypothetical protein
MQRHAPARPFPAGIEPDVNWRNPERPAKRDPADERRATQITVQYRSRGGMIYELEGPSGSVALHVVRSAPEASPVEWVVKAGPDLSGSSVVQGRGSTAAEALSAVSDAWRCHIPALVPVDWEAIVHELRRVRAA